jgi:hypothetical protein
MKDIQCPVGVDKSSDPALERFRVLLGKYQRMHFDSGLDNFVNVFQDTLHSHLNKLESYRLRSRMAVQEHSSYGAWHCL